MKQLIYALVLVPFFTQAQQNNTINEQNGIQFIKGISWQKLVEKAQAEKKNILVDCYTTWCLPCKKMDKEIFADSKVGDFYNKNFISYKIQLDSTKNDNETVKATYADARYIQSGFEVNSFPTVLFCSPDGILLKRLIGLTSTDEFIKLGEEVLDPKKNYYALLEAYKKGTRDFAAMRTIANNALSLVKDTITANTVVKEYMATFPKKNYLDKENIEFMYSFTKSSKDPGFKFFYNNTSSINNLMGDKMYAQGLIRYIIFMDMVWPVLKKLDQSGKTPGWTNLYNAIRTQYNQYYADYVITMAKMDWYGAHKNWKDYSHYLVTYVDKYVAPYVTGYWTSFILNNHAWDVFKRSNNKRQLERALSWSGKALLLQVSSNWMDTYANLLYKLGNTELALQWQQTAVSLAPDFPEYKENLKLMKEGKPTWPSN